MELLVIAVDASSQKAQRGIRSEHSSASTERRMAGREISTERERESEREGIIMKKKRVASHSKASGTKIKVPFLDMH